MKKLYTLALAAVVAISASAATHELRTDRVAKKVAKTELRSTGKITANTTAKKVLGMKKADALETIEGTWTFTLGDYYNGQNSMGPFEWDFEATVDGTTVTFVDPYDYFFYFVGEFDEANSTMSFSRQYTETYEAYYIYQEPYVYSYALGNIIIKDKIEAVYSSENGSLTFEADNGLAWSGYSDQAGNSKLGYFDIYDMEGAYHEGFEPEPEEFDEEQAGLWETIGTASLVDAWILPSYTQGGAQINPNENVIEGITLQQNTENTYLYRLWKPYTNENGFLLSQLNQSSYDGQIQFEISDMKHVEVVACGLPAGFKNSNGEFFFTNELGWLVNNNPTFDKDVIIELVYTNEDTGVIDPADTYNPETGVVTINTPVFDFSSAHADGYSWNNNPYSAVITSEALIDPTLGVANIEVENAPVEYFNLQGVRVANPEKGSVVIKRQGTTATKVLVK